VLFRQRKTDVLSRTVTGDEKWIMHDNPRRRHSWVSSG
ncbi:hypothetical protein EAI_16104, partial [Harpegnathos saltator]